MGYFSNGTEGMIYEEQYCQSCVHGDDDDGCPIMMVHLLWNYDQIDEDEKVEMLDTLIPRSDDKLQNEKCAMFVRNSKHLWPTPRNEESAT